MGAHLRNGCNISVEQQQHIGFQTPESRAGNRPAGLQQSDEAKYQLSPAAAERLRRLRQRSAVNQRERYESTGCKTSLASFNDLQSYFANSSNNVEPINTQTASNRVQNLGGQYEYCNKPADSLFDPALIQSEPKQQSSIDARYPLASTPATIYSTPYSFRVLQPALASTEPPVLLSRQPSPSSLSTPAVPPTTSRKLERIQEELEDSPRGSDNHTPPPFAHTLPHSLP
ncbi:hypothetical protein PGTUg99_033853 [Puccinia graminis f. sp. tritici]|uniref:Uncharacterized protein n=1 Tax=Puccinia graminis f. sp. tritici TaxID=56615 RepID=A0A5B0SL60_PUCGR|nr:hypothetical protein PGTUg99_033853 [Puccinia graminis f. sp. tritici]